MFRKFVVIGIKQPIDVRIGDMKQAITACMVHHSNIGCGVLHRVVYFVTRILMRRSYTYSLVKDRLWG